MKFRLAHSWMHCFPLGISTARVRVARNRTRVLTLLVKVKAAKASGSRVRRLSVRSALSATHGRRSNNTSVNAETRIPGAGPLYRHHEVAS
jgi:hypothetical protein